MSVTLGAPEPILVAFTLKRSLPLTTRETLTTVKVDPFRTLTLSLRLRADVAVATTLPSRTIVRPEILKRSSGLVHEAASCTDVDFGEMVTP